MKQWKNHSAFGKVKTGLELLAADTAQILDDVLNPDSDPTLAAGKVSIGVEKMAQVTGVLQSLDYAEFSLLPAEICGYLSDSINAKKAYSPAERAEAWKLTYLILTDFPATLEGVLSGQIDDWHEYGLLINKLRKARNLSLVFGSKALTTNSALQFGTLFVTMPENMAELAGKQIDKYKSALELYQVNSNVPQLTSTLRSVFGNLEVMHRDFRMGTLWGLCQGLIEALPENPAEGQGTVALELLRSFSTILAQLKQHGINALTQNVPEKILEKILDVIATAPVKTSRLKGICLWYNLKLGYSRDFRKANKALLVSFSRKGATVKAAKFLTEEINGLYDAINNESAALTLDAKRMQEFMLSLSRISSTFHVLSMGQQAEDVDASLALFKQHQHAMETNGNPDTQRLLTRTAQTLYLSEIALLSRSQQLGRAIAHPSTGVGDILTGPKLSLVAAALKNFDSVLLTLDSYVESACDANLLRNVVTPLAEIHIALTVIPLRRAASFVDGAIQYTDKLLKFSESKVLTVDSTLRDLAHLLLNTRSYLEQLSNDRTTNFQWALDPNERFLKNMEALSGESFADIHAAPVEDALAAAFVEFSEPAIDMPVEVASADGPVDLQLALESIIEASVAVSENDMSLPVETQTADVAAPVQSTTLAMDDLAEDIDFEIALSETIAAPEAVSADVAAIATAVTNLSDAIPMLSTVVVETEDDDLKAIFTEEAEGILQDQAGYFAALNESLRNREALADLRRSFHTLKGSGRMVEARAIGELAWSAENLLNSVIAGRVTLDVPMLAILRRIHDTVPGMIVDFKSAKPCAADPASVSDFVAEVNRFLRPGTELPVVAPVEVPAPAPVVEVADVSVVEEAEPQVVEPVEEPVAEVTVLETEIVEPEILESAVVEAVPVEAQIVESGVVEAAPIEVAVVDEAPSLIAMESAPEAYAAVEELIQALEPAPEILEANVVADTVAEIPVEVEAPLAVHAEVEAEALAEVAPEVRAEAEPEAYVEAVQEVHAEVESEVHFETAHHFYAEAAVEPQAEAFHKDDVPVNTAVAVEAEVAFEPEVAEELVGEVAAEVVAEVMAENAAEVAPEVSPDAPAAEVVLEAPIEVTAEVVAEFVAEAPLEVTAEVVAEVVTEVALVAAADIRAEVVAEIPAETPAEVIAEVVEAVTYNELVPEEIDTAAEDKQTATELFDIFVAEVARQLGRIREYLNNPHALDDNGYSVSTTSFLIPVHTLYGSSRTAHFDEFGHMVSPLERLLQSHPYQTVTTTVRLLLIQFCQVAEQVSEYVVLHRNLSLQGALGNELANLRFMIEDAEAELSGSRRIETRDIVEATVPAATTVVETPVEVSAEVPAGPLVESVVATVVEAVFEPALESVPEPMFETLALAAELIEAPELDEEALVLRGFLQEAQATTALLHQIFASFRANPGNRQLLAQLHNQLNLLEGAASVANQHSIADMSRAMALAYQQYSQQLYHMSPAIIEVLTQGHDYLASALRALSEGLMIIDGSSSVVTSLQSLVDAQIAEKAKSDQSDGDQQVEEELLAVFVAEADELLRDIDKRVADWEETPDDENVVNDMLRLLHTLKGSAALVGESGISESAHAFESVIIESSRNPAACDARFFEQLHAQLETLQTLYAQHGNTDLVAAPEHTSAPVSPAQLREDTTTIVDESPELVATAEEAPAQTRNGQVFYIRPDVIPEPKEQVAEPAAENTAAVDDHIRVSGNLLRSLLNDADEINIARNRVEQNLTDLRYMLGDMDETLGRLKGYIEKFEAHTKNNRSDLLADVGLYHGSIANPQSDFDALEMDRYTEFQQIALSLLEDYDDLGEIRKTLAGKLKVVDGILGQQQRFTNRLQDGLISSQMVPFAGMVPRLRRLTRQVSSELGKQVTIKFSNPEGRMDRSILQSLYGPLEHMIRNAIDHGIESPAERLQKGKPEQGTILVKLYRQGASVNLDLSDDGRGIDVESVRRKGVAMGLLQEGAAITEQAAYQLIFAPGFSTASALSKISGRGVGLDVVHNEISQIGGDIDVSSKPSEGTTFKFRLPLTASLNRALLFTLNGTQYVMLLNTIDGIMLETAENLRHYATLKETTKLHYSKRSYDLAYLGQVLDGNDKPTYADCTHSLPILLIAGNKRQMALQVDSIVGSRELVVKPLPTQFSHINGVSGVVVLGDGTVVPVLDPVALVDEFTQHEEQGIAPVAAAPVAPVAIPLTEHEAHHTTVLVVDDSITVRKVTSAMLKRNGMKVLVAKDGVEAVELLQSTVPDVMLLDIEMPKMDGFEVASWVRRQPESLQKLPIIMITSRIGDKHRQRAAEIGVNEYMCKPFQEENLLDAIARFTSPLSARQITG